MHHRRALLLLLFFPSLPLLFILFNYLFLLCSLPTPALTASSSPSSHVASCHVFLRPSSGLRLPLRPSFLSCHMSERPCRLSQLTSRKQTFTDKHKMLSQRSTVVVFFCCFFLLLPEQFYKIFPLKETKRVSHAEFPLLPSSGSVWPSSEVFCGKTSCVRH